MTNQWFSPASTLLTVTDIQEKLAAAMPAKHVQGNVTRAAKLIKAANKLAIPTVATEQYSDRLGPTLPVIKTELSEFDPINKLSFSCCEEIAYLDAIEDSQATTIALCGLETHVSVLQTALALQEKSKNVIVVEDACCSRYSNDHSCAIDLLAKTGIHIVTFELLLFAWLKRAGTDEFKSLSHLTLERDY